MIKEAQNPTDIIKITASSPLKKEQEFFRIVLRQVKIGRELCFQAEKFKDKQVFHENISLNSLSSWLDNNLIFLYKQVCIVLQDKDVTYLFSANGKSKRLEKRTQNKNAQAQDVNRAKNYLINEGDNLPVMVDLGIFTKDNKIARPMFDKFKQINRFVEILHHQFKDYAQDSVTILDFGCGKSYLTFIVYHYFSVIKKINVKIIGYDLKKDVVANCNALAIKYGYSNLKFVVADVSKDKLYGEHIDCVISLHACDTATDYALFYALQHGVKHIFSVPCCQHQINQTIGNGGDFDLLLKYGLVKERFSALLTDSIRAMILEDFGYSVDMLEFVDFSHSPKNLMIRACKTHGKSDKNRKTIYQLCDKYKFEQKLFDLTK